MATLSRFMRELILNGGWFEDHREEVVIEEDSAHPECTRKYTSVQDLTLFFVAENAQKEPLHEPTRIDFKSPEKSTHAQMVIKGIARTVTVTKEGTATHGVIIDAENNRLMEVPLQYTPTLRNGDSLHVGNICISCT
jgi:hypothetical protein